MAGHTLACFMFYTLAPFVLKLSGATLFNLSILTSDMWTVIVRIFFYKQEVDWLYYLSLATVVVGLVAYSVTEKEPVSVPVLEDENSYHQLVNDESEAARNATRIYFLINYRLVFRMPSLADQLFLSVVMTRILPDLCFGFVQ